MRDYSSVRDEKNLVEYKHGSRHDSCVVLGGNLDYAIMRIFRKEGFTKTTNITICRMLIRAGKDTQTLETNANSLQLPKDTSKNNPKPNLLTANNSQSLWYKRCTPFRQACFSRNYRQKSVFMLDLHQSKATAILSFLSHFAFSSP